jgi:hypothetical protein
LTRLRSAEAACTGAQRLAKDQQRSDAGFKIKSVPPQLIGVDARSDAAVEPSCAGSLKSD